MGDKKCLKCDDYTLTLGRLIQPQITVTKIKNAPTEILSTNKVSGLYAVDGNVNQLKSIYSHLSPSAVEAAIKLGVFEELIDLAGLGVVGQEDFNEVDGIENLLKGGFGGGGGLNLSSSNSVIGAPEGGKTKDLRTKTPIDKFADFIVRSDLLKDFNEQLRKALGQELFEEGNPLAGISSSGGRDDGGGGGGGEISLSGANTFAGVTPNITLLGGDGFLSKLLNGLFSTLDTMLNLLNKESESVGGGATPGGGGGGGSGGGGELGSGLEPVVAIGNLTIYLPSTDFEGLIALLLQMIAEAIALANAFDLTLEDILKNLLEGAAARRRPQGGGGGGGGGGATPGSLDRGGGGAIQYIYPEGVEPANITIIAPDESLENLDLDELLAALDELLFALDGIKERGELDEVFELDLEALTEQAELAANKSPASGNQSVSSSGEGGGAGGGGGFPVSPTEEGSIIQKLVEVRDISGVVGGGVAPLPSRRKKRAVGGGSYGSGGGGSYASGGGGDLSSGAASGLGGGLSGGLTSSPSSGGGLTSSSDLSSSSGLSGTSQPNYSGNTGEFNFDGWASDGQGFGEEAKPFEGTEFSITPIIPNASGFYLPTTTVSEVLTETENEFVSVPPDFSFTPLYEGDILFIPGATASNLVQWELADNIPGIEILTPFDLEPTIKFNDNYAGDFLRLKLFLRGASDIFEILTINTVPTSQATLYGYSNTGKLLEFNQSKVDPTTLLPVPQFENDGAERPTSILFRFSHPPFHSTWAASSYTVQEKNPDLSWTDVGTTIAPEFIFEVGKTYRILTNYDNQLQSVASDEFSIENPPVLGQSSVSNLDGSTRSSAISLSSTPPTLFYTFFSDEIIDDAYVNEGNQITTATKFIAVTSTPPSLFYTFNSEEIINDGYINEGTYYTIATKAIAPVSTPPTLFYTV